MPDTFSLELHNVLRQGEHAGGEDLLFQTNDGNFRARLHHGAEGTPSIIWMFGAGGGLGGPAGGVYERLGRLLAPETYASLQCDYRHPGDLIQCTLDILAAVAFMNSLGHERVVLVGHSFGGAVAIHSGAISERVTAVAALSSQSAGTHTVADLSPRPLLVIHGEADEVLSDTCSRVIYQKAKEPKQLILYPGCRHGLDQCREELDRDLIAWLTGPASQAPGM